LDYRGVAVDTQDRPTVVGYDPSPYPDGGGEPSLVLNRLTAGGAADSTFGSAGQAVASIFPQSAGYAIIRQPDGKILAGGFALGDGGQQTMALARFCP